MIKFTLFLAIISFISTLILSFSLEPTPQNTLDYIRKKDLQLDFRINFSGLYSINLFLDEPISKNDSLFFISSTLTPKGESQDFPNKIIVKDTFLKIGSFYAKKDSYRFKINKLDPRLKNKKITLEVLEATGTASKSLYFATEFRPFYIKLFKVFRAIFIICFVSFTGLLLINKIRLHNTKK